MTDRHVVLVKEIESGYVTSNWVYNTRADADAKCENFLHSVNRHRECFVAKVVSI